MKIGTKSILFGVHCFFIHPWFVAMAWNRLYGFPRGLRLWVAFFVHDLGYWDKPNMDGPEGEIHPELGGRIMKFLFGKAYIRFEGEHVWCVGSNYWQIFTLGHSRYYANKTGIKVSRLCAADKLAFCFESYWFYMLRARLSGEIYEYLENAQDHIAGSRDPKVWFKFVHRHFLKWVAKNYKTL